MHATDLCPTLGNMKEYISKCGILLNHRSVVNFEQFSVFIGPLKTAGNTTCLIIFLHRGQNQNACCVASDMSIATLHNRFP